MLCRREDLYGPGSGVRNKKTQTVPPAAAPGGLECTCIEEGEEEEEEAAERRRQRRRHLAARDGGLFFFQTEAASGERRLVWVPATSLDEYYYGGGGGGGGGDGDYCDDNYALGLAADGELMTADDIDEMEDLDNFVILADENYAEYIYDDNITSCNKVGACYVLVGHASPPSGFFLKRNRRSGVFLG